MWAHSTTYTIWTMSVATASMATPEYIDTTRQQCSSSSPANVILSGGGVGRSGPGT